MDAAAPNVNQRAVRDMKDPCGFIESDFQYGRDRHGTAARNAIRVRDTKMTIREFSFFGSSRESDSSPVIHAAFDTRRTARNSTLVTAARLAFSSR